MRPPLPPLPPPYHRATLRVARSRWALTRFTTSPVVLYPLNKPSPSNCLPMYSSLPKLLLPPLTTQPHQLSHSLARPPFFLSNSARPSPFFFFFLTRSLALPCPRFLGRLFGFGSHWEGFFGSHWEGFFFWPLLDDSDDGGRNISSSLCVKG